MGFNHTYKFNIEINNFPQDKRKELDDILDKLESLIIDETNATINIVHLND